jgi:hypothetical protein
MKGEGVQGDLVFYFVIVLQFHWVVRSPRRIGGGAVLIFGSWRTAVVSTISEIFARSISCNRCKSSCRSLSYLSIEYLCVQFGEIF